MKLCTSQYSHESMPDAKFESGSFSSFGDMTSQKFPLKRGTVIKFRYLPPEMDLSLKKMSFMPRFVLFDSKLTPPSMSISAIFKRRKIFSFSKFLGRLDEKRAAATPWLTTKFAKIWSEHVSKIKTRSHKVLVSQGKRFLNGSSEFGHLGLWAPPPPPWAW